MHGAAAVAKQQFYCPTIPSLRMVAASTACRRQTNRAALYYWSHLLLKIRPQPPLPAVHRMRPSRIRYTPAKFPVPVDCVGHEPISAYSRLEAQSRLRTACPAAAAPRPSGDIGYCRHNGTGTEIRCHAELPAIFGGSMPASQRPVVSQDLAAIGPLYSAVPDGRSFAAVLVPSTTKP